MTSSAKKSKLVLSLDQTLDAGLNAYALSLHRSREDAVEDLIRERLLDLGMIPDALLAQALAIQQLLTTVDDLVADRRATESWSVDVINEVFDTLRDEHRPTYDIALNGQHAGQVNRRIGRRIRRGLNADLVLKPNERIDMGKTPKGVDSLIKTWTKLQASHT